MSGFASGLLAGTNAARGWVDTYNQATDRARADEQREQRQAIMNAQPEQVQGFTPAQGQQLEKAAQQGAQIGWDADSGSYTIQQPGTEPGAEGTAMQLVSPKQTTHFLGNVTEGAMSPAQTMQARYAALGQQAITNDPDRGVITAANLGKAAEAQVAQEQAKELESKANDFYKNLSQMPMDQLVRMAGQIINPAESGVPAMVSYNPSTGKAYLASDIPGLPAGEVSRADLMNALGQSFVAGKGDLSAGVKSLADSMQTLRNRQSNAAMTGLKMDTQAAQAANYHNQAANRDAVTAIRQQQVDQQGDYYGGRLALSAERNEINASKAAAGSGSRSSGKGQDTNGIPTDATIEKSADFKALDKALRDAVTNGEMDVTTANQKRAEFRTQVKSTAAESVMVTRAKQMKASGVSAADVAKLLQDAGTPTAGIARVMQAAGFTQESKGDDKPAKASGGDKPSAMKLPSASSAPASAAKAAPAASSAPKPFNVDELAAEKRARIQAQKQADKADEARREAAAEERAAASRQAIAANFMKLYGSNDTGTPVYGTRK